MKVKFGRGNCRQKKKDWEEKKRGDNMHHSQLLCVGEESNQ